MASRRLTVGSGGWLVAAVGAGAAALAVQACSSSFTGCAESRDCGSSGGTSAGSGGEAGATGAEAGGSSGKAGGGNSGGSKAGSSSAGAPSGNAGTAGGEAGAGDAGQPSGGEAGAGGEGPVPQCRQDSDCSDHLACNGVETCHAGVCNPGVSPCANPEPAHCDVVCAEASGAASCTVRGQDKDNDGHFSSACVTNPGDDCNDAAPTIYPGAPELCDRLDNDCDGKVDLNDGLAPGGATVVIGPNGATSSLPTIAWATDKSVYGIAYRDITSSSTADLYLEEVDQKGVVTLTPTAFNDTTTTVVPYYLAPGLGLTWGGDGFGAVWTTTKGIYLQPLGSNGIPTSFAVKIPSQAGFVPVDNPVVARVGGGNWGVFFYSYQASGPGLLQGNTVSAAGTVSSPVNTSQVNDFKRFSLAASGPNFVVATTIGPSDAPAGRANLWSSAFVVGTSLTVSGLSPIVASGPNGIAIATSGASTADPPRFYAYSASGTTQCGPVVFADQTFHPAAVAATSNGYLVVSSGTLRVQEILANCTLGESFTLDSYAAVDNVGVAAGAAGYGVVWHDINADVPKRRLFGPNFCD